MGWVKSDVQLPHSHPLEGVCAGCQVPGARLAARLAQPRSGAVGQMLHLVNLALAELQPSFLGAICPQGAFVLLLLRGRARPHGPGLALAHCCLGRGDACLMLRLGVIKLLWPADIKPYPPAWPLYVVRTSPWALGFLSACLHWVNVRRDRRVLSLRQLSPAHQVSADH